MPAHVDERRDERRRRARRVEAEPVEEEREHRPAIVPNVTQPTRLSETVTAIRK
jgi:hypothetical protein